MKRFHIRQLRTARLPVGALIWSLAAALTLVIADRAFSQSPQGSQPEPAKPSVDSPLRRGLPQPVQPPDTKGADAGCGSHGSAGDTAPQPSAEGPQPHYVCESKVVTLDPVWAGSPIQATWTIKNTGEGDLSIKLKGG
jgi:hypothetical protein